MKNYIQSIKIIILGSIIAGGFGLASAWVVPATTPPGGNVPAPINVSNSPQYKIGKMGLGSGVMPRATFDVSGVAKLDQMLVFNNSVIGGKLVVGSANAPTASSASLDVTGEIVASSLNDPSTGSGLRSLCADVSGRIILCP